jgi:hypothetical protein
MSLPLVAQAAEGNDDTANMYAPKFVQSYADFIQTADGWSYRDVKSSSSTAAAGASDGSSGYQAQIGDRVVFDWSGESLCH